MILFYRLPNKGLYVVDSAVVPDDNVLMKLKWLFGGAELLPDDKVEGIYIGPRKEMITPWSTNAVEITMNMGLTGIRRIEEFRYVLARNARYDKMLQEQYVNPDSEVFTIRKHPDPVIFVTDVRQYNEKEGLALNSDEINYLEGLAKKMQRPLTDSEVYGFAQVNSEHCRHKIFNGTFIIDGIRQPESLFRMIKMTSKKNKNFIVSAYKDNVAFIEGPMAEQFAPESQDKPDFFKISRIPAVISLKAETHNFPTTVEPFNGASTGSGGEIRDRMAGGTGSIPLAGTAVYMTSYTRVDENKHWEVNIPARQWLYQSPLEILIKASNGASDFGNLFGQPLICGSVLTFEYAGKEVITGYDKVIMLAGGIGYASKNHSLKKDPAKGDKIVILGGDNYRIGMGGGAVSSVDTGQYSNAIELNAVQRANPEMQKRVYNALRALCESDKNPLVSVHDHGAGGHLNCISELVGPEGGVIFIDELPKGDPTLSDKEIIGNESQERMGIVIHDEDLPLLKRIAERERAPIYIAGEITGDRMLKFISKKSEINPVELMVEDMFGNTPSTVINDNTKQTLYTGVPYDRKNIHEYLSSVLMLESVACKDWLTNKVDRSVTGRIACQQTCGEIQLPLNNLGAVCIDYSGISGIATGIGHAPACGLINPESGSVMSIAEALTNIIWAPLKGRLGGVSLSANWMWPSKNTGEDARLYKAVKAASEFAIQLGINIPTGKDSLSMTQKYPDGRAVNSPGTVIISAAGQVTDISKIIKPLMAKDVDCHFIYIDMSGMESRLGGSSLFQVMGSVGEQCPSVADPEYFKNVFNTVQSLIEENKIVAGHDISAGGMITALLEMTFPLNGWGMDINLESIEEDDIISLLFSENPGLILQVRDMKCSVNILAKNDIQYHVIGRPSPKRGIRIEKGLMKYLFDIDKYRDIWFRTSWIMDKNQSGEKHALERYSNYKKQPLIFHFGSSFSGDQRDYGIFGKRPHRTGIRAAIIREKGVNGDREMAYSLYYAGFDVRDVHMTDLVSGRETLQDINMIVFVGGFSNSDVFGSAKGWAGAFLFNEPAKKALDGFYARNDTLSLGVCNGCQLMMELGLIYPSHEKKPSMKKNDSGKFESAFLNVEIPSNKSVMFESLSGMRLGVWVAHGEGKFALPYHEDEYHIAARYSYSNYPGNPNGSNYDTAALVSGDGRHLAMMPHIERAIFPWQWAYYPEDRKSDRVSPWMEAFVNARRWIKNTMKNKGK